MALAASGYAICKLIGAPLAGSLADATGQKRLLLCGLITYLAVALIYFHPCTAVWLVVGRLLQGGACAILRISTQHLLSIHYDDQSRGSAMGRFDSSFYLAIGIAPIIGGWLMERGGFKPVFTTVLLCCLFATSLALMMPIHTIKPEQPEPSDVKPVNQTKKMTSHRLNGLLLFVFGRACSISACAIWLPFLFVENLQLGGFRVGLLLACSPLITAIILPFSGQVADRLPRCFLIVAGGILSSLGQMLWSNASGFSSALAIALAIGAFNAFSQPAVSALLAKEGEYLGVGKTIGMFQASLNAGFLLGPLFGAILYKQFGLQPMFAVLGLIGVLTGIGFALTFMLTEDRQQPKSLGTRLEAGMNVS